MSYRSSVQCVEPSFSEKVRNEGLDKTCDGSQSHLLSLSTTTEPVSISKKTVARGGEATITVMSHLLEQAARRISWVHTPLIVAGSGILQRPLQTQFIEFATRLEIPITSTLAAQESIPNAHPLWIGPISSPQIYSRYGFDWADLVIVVGCDAAGYASEYWNPDGDIPILHVGSSSAVKSVYYQPTLELVGNISYLLAELLRRSNRQGKGVSYPLELRALNQKDI